MRYVGLALLFLVAVPGPVVAGGNNISLWMGVDDGEVTLSPWYVYTGATLNVDVRHNFDQKGSLTAFVGKSFGSEKFSVSPYAGFMAGEYSAACAQVNLFTAHGRVSAFSMNLYAAAVGEKPNSFVHFTDVLVRVSSKVSVGVDEVVYKEAGSDTSFTLGPALKIQLGSGLYGRIWVAHHFDDGSTGFTLGFGFAP